MVEHWLTGRAPEESISSLLCGKPKRFSKPSSQPPVPEAASILERRLRLDDPEVSRQRSSQGIAKGFGELFVHSWRRNGVTPEEIIGSVTGGNAAGLALEARLEGLALILKQADVGETLRAFEQSAAIADRRIRVAVARICWAQVLPSILSQGDGEELIWLAEAIRRLAPQWRDDDDGPANDILFHAVRHGALSARMFDLLLGEAVTARPEPWLVSSQPGVRLVDGTQAGIVGAQRAFEILIEHPQQHAHMASAVLGQLRKMPRSDDAVALGLRLAVRIEHIEATIDFLERSGDAPSEWTRFVPVLRRMIKRRYASGNPVTQRDAVRLEAELARLKLDPQLSWETLAAQATAESNDMNLSHLVRALGFMLPREGQPVDSDLRWLLEFATDKGPETRREVLRVFSTNASARLDLVSTHIDRCLDLALGGQPDGEMIAPLSTPIFEGRRS